MILSFSQINAKKACSFRWFLRYKLRIEAMKKSKPLAIGTMGHSKLHNALVSKYKMDRHFESINWPDHENQDQYSEEEWAKIDSFYDDCDDIVGGVVDDFEGWTFLELEAEVKTTRKSQGNTHDFIGYVDAIATDPDGFSWIIDWKFRNSFNASEQWNPQPAMYRRMVLDTFNIDVQGIIIYEIKPQLPALPKLNKNGTMSRSACRTDWETYKTELIANGLNPDDYADMKSKLENKQFRKANRYYLDLSSADRVIDTAIVPFANQIAESERSVNDEGVAIRDMDLAQASQHYGLQYGFTCTGCEYRPICTSIPYGLEDNEVLNLGFRVKEESKR